MVCRAHPGGNGQEVGGDSETPPSTPKGLPLGDCRTLSPAQVLGVLLDSGTTWFAGKTTALSVMGKNLCTCYFLHETTSSAGEGWSPVL